MHHHHIISCPFWSSSSSPPSPDCRGSSCSLLVQRAHQLGLMEAPPTEGGTSSLLFMPLLVSTVGYMPVLTHVLPGSGLRQLAGMWDSQAAEAIQVAISWACLNATLLKRLSGSAGRGSLFASNEDLWMTIPTGLKSGVVGVHWVHVWPLPCSAASLSTHIERITSWGSRLQSI